MNYSLILFDLDGTLVDSQPGIVNCLQYALSKFGITKDADELRQYIGPPIKDIFASLLKTDDEAKILEATLTYREKYSVTGYLEGKLYDGVPEMLKTLHESQFKIALATSKPREYAVKILEHFGMLTYFDTVCGSALDGLNHSKTDIISNALSCFDNEEIGVMVGDRSFDFVGAENMGLDYIAVTYGYGSIDEINRFSPVLTAQTEKEIVNFLSRGCPQMNSI